jgi:hypothetical protein
MPSLATTMLEPATPTDYKKIRGPKSCNTHIKSCKRRMEEKVVGLTSSASNVHEVANDNTNPCRNMVMDAMRMNQGNVSQCPIVEE